MPGRAGLVSIIIVNWNTRDLLLDCLRSIREGTTDVPYEIVVLDNASSDGSADALRSMMGREISPAPSGNDGFPEIRLIAGEENLGFAAGNNRAFAESTGEFIAFLNPDTVVPPGAIRGMVDFLVEHPEVGFVGPRLVGANGETQVSSFGLFPSPLEAAAHAFRIWRIAPRSGLAQRFCPAPRDDDTWVYTEHLLGACLVARREMLDQIGLFDEGFFLFLEETDLCYRAGQAGWRTAYCTGVHVVHLGEQSMQKILHRTGGLYIRSYNRFCRKHGLGWARRAAVNMFLVAGIFAESLTGIVKWRSPRRAWSSLRALWYGYVALP